MRAAGGADYPGPRRFPCLQGIFCAAHRKLLMNKKSLATRREFSGRIREIRHSASRREQY
jgi:hypothetical protein